MSFGIVTLLLLLLLLSATSARVFQASAMDIDSSPAAGPHASQRSLGVSVESTGDVIFFLLCLGLWTPVALAHLSSFLVTLPSPARVRSSLVAFMYGSMSACVASVTCVLLMVVGFVSTARLTGYCNVGRSRKQQDPDHFLEEVRQREPAMANVKLQIEEERRKAVIVQQIGPVGYNDGGHLRFPKRPIIQEKPEDPTRHTVKRKRHGGVPSPARRARWFKLCRQAPENTNPWAEMPLHREVRERREREMATLLAAQSLSYLHVGPGMAMTTTEAPIPSSARGDDIDIDMIDILDMERMDGWVDVFHQQHQQPLVQGQQPALTAFTPLNFPFVNPPVTAPPVFVLPLITAPISAPVSVFAPPHPAPPVSDPPVSKKTTRSFAASAYASAYASDFYSVPACPPSPAAPTPITAPPALAPAPAPAPTPAPSSSSAAALGPVPTATTAASAATTTVTANTGGNGDNCDDSGDDDSEDSVVFNLGPQVSTSA